MTDVFSVEPSSVDVAPLGKFTLPVENWNPRDHPTEVFNYVDISSIDNQRNVISAIHELEGREAPSRARRLIEAGDVLFANVRPGLRNIALVDDSFRGIAVASTGFSVLRPNPQIRSRYLFHLVKSEFFVDAITRTQTGTSYPATSEARVKAQVVPVPSVNAQADLCVLLDRADERFEATNSEVAHAQESLQRFERAMLDRLVSGATTAWVGEDDDGPKDAPSDLPAWIGDPNRFRSDWEWLTLGEVATSIDYGTSEKTVDDAQTGIPVLRMGNIQEGRLDWQSLKYLPSSSVPEKLLLAPGDVLFTRTNGSPDLVGKAAVYNAAEKSQVTYASYLIRVRLDSARLSSEWLVMWLSSSWGRRWALTVRTAGVSQSNISGTKLAALQVPSPPVDDQHRAVEAYREIRSICQGAQASLADALTRAARARTTIHNSTLWPTGPSPTFDEVQSGREMVDMSDDTPVRTTVPKRSRANRANEADLAALLRRLGPSSPGALWQASTFAGDVDRFYRQLRGAIIRGEISEVRSEEATVLLRANDED